MAYPKFHDPVIHGLLRVGETMNVIAAPKVGKSWLAYDLAIAVATGRSWLGRYQTEAGPVLIIDNKLHSETSAHRLSEIAQARGVAMREIADRIFFVGNLRGRLQGIFTLAPNLESLEPGQFKVIILNCFDYRFMPVGMDENDIGTTAEIYNRIDAFADRLGCCFVLTHDATEGIPSGQSVTDVGAGALSSAAATHLVLRPHAEDGVVVLDAAVRSWPPIDPCCLRWAYPVWLLAPELDPEALKGARG